MANLSFRPRPLDINKKLPVFRAKEETFDDDQTRRTVPQLSTGVEEHEEKEVHLKRILMQDKKATASGIPIPQIVAAAKGRGNAKAFVRPAQYIRYHGTLDRPKAGVEYDLDSEDEVFLNEYNSKHKNTVSEDRFEALIDKWEKVTAFGEPIPLDQATKQAPGKATQAEMKPIHAYWLEKRLKYKKPLLRLFVPPARHDDPNPFVVFRPHEKEDLKRKKMRKNDYPAFLKLKQLRIEFERARSLLDLMRQRDALKKMLYETERDVLRRQFKKVPKASRAAKLSFPTAAGAGTSGAVRPGKTSVLPLDVDDAVSESSAHSSENETSPPASPRLAVVYEYERRAAHTLAAQDSLHREPMFRHTARPVYDDIVMPNGERFRGRRRRGRGGRLMIDRPGRAFDGEWSSKRARHCLIANTQFEPEAFFPGDDDDPDFHLGFDPTEAVVPPLQQLSFSTPGIDVPTGARKRKADQISSPAAPPT